MKNVVKFYAPTYIHIMCTCLCTYSVYFRCVLKVVEIKFFFRHSLNAERAEVSPQLVDNGASEGGLSSSSTTSGVSSPTSSSSLNSHIEEVPATEKPKFIFTPVNRFGNAVEEGRHLEDTGK